jgi:NAD(P)-dependent dehydrogenase (short-subunit alcohol dehydrogenase family)
MRQALVTGAASGIGRATAIRLAHEGWELTLLDRDGERVADTARLIGSAGAHPQTLVGDLSQPDWIETEVGAFIRGWQVDLLVNDAGVGFRATAADTADEQWDLTMAVNLSAPFRLCRLVLPPMISRGHGVIVNVASAGGIVGLRQRVAYCASKAGVIGLTRALAADHAHQGIRINAIAPGTVDTEWVARMLDGDPDAAQTRAAMEQRQLDGKMGTPDEVAGGIAFLAGDSGRFVNGSVFVMDAGLTAV